MMKKIRMNVKERTELNLMYLIGVDKYVSSKEHDVKVRKELARRINSKVCMKNV